MLSTTREFFFQRFSHGASVLFDTEFTISIPSSSYSETYSQSQSCSYPLVSLLIALSLSPNISKQRVDNKRKILHSLRIDVGCSQISALFSRILFFLLPFFFFISSPSRVIRLSPCFVCQHKAATVRVYTFISGSVLFSLCVSLDVTACLKIKRARTHFNARTCS